MARREKSVVVHEVSSRGAVDKKGKRVSLRTREVIDFDPKPCFLRSQKVVEYLAIYGVRLPSNIEGEWCPAKTDITMSPPTGSLYFHSQNLGFGGETRTDSLCP